MKPFNLKKALAGESVITRDGRKALQILHFDKVVDQNANGVIATFIEDGNSIIEYYINGNYFQEEESEYDLFMDTKTKKLWIAVSKNQNTNCSHHCTNAYTSKEHIREYTSISNKYEWRLIEIEIEE
jgi:hypothetical protein